MCVPKISFVQQKEKLKKKNKISTSELISNVKIKNNNSCFFFNKILLCVCDLLIVVNDDDDDDLKN